jgi:hypothetical protein
MLICLFLHLYFIHLINFFYFFRILLKFLNKLCLKTLKEFQIYYIKKIKIDEELNIYKML